MGYYIPMIETFTKAEFEAKLPKSQNFPIKHEGLIQGEYCYSMLVGKAKVFIRSSIGPNGVSAGIGQDSIRVFLVDDQNQHIGSKINKWTTRKPGWDFRTIQNCRTLIKLAKLSGADKGGVKIFKAKTPENKGRFFSSINGQFIKWLTDSKGEIL